MKVTCFKCEGSGGRTCRNCGGSGVMYPAPAIIVVWRSYKAPYRNRTCAYCGGSGKIKCRICKGTGFVKAIKERGDK